MRSWLIADTSALRGTVYFEFLPGRYQDQCWGPNSVFLDEESFGFIEPYFVKHVPKYDHYSFVEINRSLWRDLLSEFDSLAELLGRSPTNAELSGRVGFFFMDTEQKFHARRAEHIELLRATVQELSEWVRAKLEDVEIVSVLGI